MIKLLIEFIMQGHLPKQEPHNLMIRVVWAQWGTVGLQQLNYIGTTVFVHYIQVLSWYEKELRVENGSRRVTVGRVDGRFFQKLIFSFLLPQIGQSYSVPTLSLFFSSFCVRGLAHSKPARLWAFLCWLPQCKRPFHFTNENFRIMTVA